MKYLKIPNKGVVDFEDAKNSKWYVQEKYDGSQFRFWVDETGNLRWGSKRIDQTTDKGFSEAINTAKNLYNLGLLEEGLVFFAEYLRNKKHNTLKYNRVPEGHLIVFDVFSKKESYWLFPEEIQKVVEDTLGGRVEYARFFGPFDNMSLAVEFAIGNLESTESSLGGTVVEGFVLKSYERFWYPQGSLIPFPAMFKIVREDFRELNKIEWGQGQLHDLIRRTINVENVWRKAIQHLREEGKLTGAPQDIPLLLQEVREDTKKEFWPVIAEILFRKYEKAIYKAMTAGLPEWYKRVLAGEEDV